MRENLFVSLLILVKIAIPLHPHSFHKPNMLSAHDFRFPFCRITFTLNVGICIPNKCQFCPMYLCECCIATEIRKELYIASMIFVIFF